MATVEKSIDVNVPVRTAYNQWTQFEEFPLFMEGVERVQQIDDVTLHWVTEIGGQRREFGARITEQTPDQRVAWHADGDIQHGGVVTFHRIDDETTRIMVQMDYEPTDAKEKLADWLGIVDRRVAADLARFKQFIESRGGETGAWRGEVKQENVESRR